MPLFDHTAIDLSIHHGRSPAFFNTLLGLWNRDRIAGWLSDLGRDPAEGVILVQAGSCTVIRGLFTHAKGLAVRASKDHEVVYLTNNKPNTGVMTTDDSGLALIVGVTPGVVTVETTLDGNVVGRSVPVEVRDGMMTGVVLPPTPLR